MYKLINTKNKEEHLCDKVTIDDGFDYYVNKTFLRINDFGYWEDANIIAQINNIIAISPETKKVIATNNPNIDVPKVVNKVEKLAKEQWGNVHRTGILGFIEGYNKSQETHPYSEEFFDWIDKEEIPREDGKWIKYFNGKDNYLTTKELLQLWKEQQPKTIYYNG